MPDEMTNPAEFIRSRLQHVLVLLDQQELLTAAALVAQAIDAIPANDDT